MSLPTHAILILLALFWPLIPGASWAAPLQLGAGDHYPLARHFTYVEDKEGRLSADELLSPSANALFRKASGPELNFGYSPSVYWLKAIVLGNDRLQEKFFLEIGYPTLDKVTIYLADGGRIRAVAEAGDLQSFSERPYLHHNLVFPLTFPPALETTLLIRVESQGSLTIPAVLWRESAFYRHSLDEYAVLSLYFGILAALFLYNLLLFLSLREPVYLAYICFVAGMAVGQLAQSGLGNEYLWPDSPAWGNIAFPAGFSATGFFGALFTILFLDTPRSAPRLNRVIVVLAAGFAFAALSPAFIPYRATAILTSLLGVTFSATAVAAGVVCLRHGHPGARYFLLAWTLLLLGVAMLGLRNMAWLPTTFVTSYGMQIGSALEMLLLSFALADRINHMRREKDAAQQEALRISSESERELANNAREWEDTFNSISDMVIILDREYRIVKANKAAADFLGAGQETVAGAFCYNLQHQDGCRPEQCPSFDTFGSGAPATREYYEPRFERHLEVSTSPIRDRDGRVAAVVHITKDVTWRKKLEEEIMRTRKLDSLAVLSGGIAHDFNNMLTVIMSTVTLAKMYAGDNARVIAKIEEAEGEILHARELTNQLLTFAKGGAPSRRLASLPELLRDTAGFSLKGSSILCEFDIADDLWAVEIDRTQISRVISNLVINAVQAMPKGGAVAVRAKNAVIDESSGLPARPGRYVRIEVEDCGCGIAPEHLQNIFDPFYTTKLGGSGLGLSTSYSIVKKHSGYIDAKSRVGSGSVFTVYLPASLEIHVEAAAPARKALSGGGRLLLMDDDEKLAKNVGELLEKLGYDVELARSGEEAIILFKRALVLSRPFDAVILDVTVPGGMGGKDCLRNLLELDPVVAAIVVSGYSEDAVLSEYERYGFREALAKPFTIEELQGKLRNAMGGGEGEG
jgi:PAS domain S-box-containing protein